MVVYELTCLHVIIYLCTKNPIRVVNSSETVVNYEHEKYYGLYCTPNVLVNVCVCVCVIDVVYFRIKTSASLWDTFMKTRLLPLSAGYLNIDFNSVLCVLDTCIVYICLLQCTYTCTLYLKVPIFFW